MNREPIAITGMACRFAGADTITDFWRIVRDGVDAIGEYRPGRFSYIDSVYAAAGQTPESAKTKAGGFLADLDRFDAEFFGVSHREARLLDPQQRLLLETAWEAFEDGGYTQKQLGASQTGVFVGVWSSDYEMAIHGSTPPSDFYATTGTGRYTASGRIAYFFDLRGPNMVIDTACSSSLVAIHLGCQSLWSGDCDMALAGGVNAILRPEITLLYSRAGMLAPDGRCKFGDASANGYVRSEGSGLVVLKPLSAAVRDNDRIYAVIRGTAVNHDGRSSGSLVAPGVPSQMELLRAALRSADVRSSDILYIEAHGTGTKAGDPPEVEAIGRIMAEDPARREPCRIGSVKTNIGHTEAAAGAAGVIKTALALYHNYLPPSLHFKEPTPRIPWDGLPVQVQTQGLSLGNGNTPLIAGVNGFGISGTNAHVVLESAPAIPKSEQSQETSRTRLLVISARSAAGLQTLAQSYAGLLKDAPEESTTDDICGWAALRRNHHSHRLAVVASDREGLVRHLNAASAGETHPLVASSRGAIYAEPQTVFVFPGQGGQWLGMGLQLLSSEPVFRDALMECDAAIQEHGGFSVVEQLHASASESRLDQIQVIQPAIFAIQVALAALWRSWGIQPTAVVGHSMGEVAAAAVAGALSISDAAQVVCARSALMQQLSGTGAMGVVGLSYSETEQALAPFQQRLSVAASNSLNSTVVSGEPEAMDALFAALQAREIFCRRVKVDVASHSPFMDAIAPELKARLAGLTPRQATTPIYSTVTGEPVDGSSLDAAYWALNLRQPVLFRNAVQELLAAGTGAFIEMSPHPVLEAALVEAAADGGRNVAVIASTRRDQDEREGMLAALGAYYVAGGSPDWAKIQPVGKPVTLPNYPWNRERFWVDVDAVPEARSAPLGGPIESSLHPGSYLWPVETAGSGTPGASHSLLEDVLEIARALAGSQAVEISSLEFLAERPPAGDTQRSAILTGEQRWTAQISERTVNGWNVICRAEVRAIETAVCAPATAPGEDTVAFTTGSGGAGKAISATLAAESRRWLGTECRLKRIATIVLYPGKPAAQGRLIPHLTREGFGATIELLAEDGTCVGSVTDALLEPADPASAARECLHELTWESTPVESLLQTPEPLSGATLLVARESHTARLLADRLRADGHALHAIWLDHAEMEASQMEEQVEAWSAGGGSPLARVVYLADTAADAGENAVTKASGSTLQLGYLIQWMTRTERTGKVPLWVVTSGVCSLPGHRVDGPGCLAAPLWGYTRMVVRNHPELTCGSVDLGTSPHPAELNLLALLIGGRGANVELALRGDAAFRPRMRPLTTPAVNAPVELRANGTYLITGARGGVGQELAQWMVERGARHLVLISRSQPDDSDRARAATFAAAGVEVRLVSSDVSNFADLSGVFADIQASMPPLAGVVHAAGVLEDQPGRWDRAHLNSVLAAKADGAWHLHLLTRLLPIDFFVLCSSSIVTLTQPGDGTYPAANSFLDSLANYRRSLGLSGLSVEWGIWTGTGMGSRSDVLRVLRSWTREGVCALTPPIARLALGQVLTMSTSCAVAVPLDRERFAAARQGDSSRGLLERYCDGAVTPSSETADALEMLQKAAPDERRQIVRQTLREQLAQVLRMDVARVDPDRPLGTAGLDSMLAVEFVRRTARALGLKLAATTLFSYPTLSALEAEIVNRLQPAAEGPPDQPGVLSTLANTSSALFLPAITDEEAVLALMEQAREN